MSQREPNALEQLIDAIVKALSEDSRPDPRNATSAGIRG